MSESISHYSVVMADTVARLEGNVMRLLDKGWEPQGGIAVEIGEEQTWYFQAMIRKEKL